MANHDPKIFSPWPCFGNAEIEAVTKVLRSGKVNQWTGSEVTGFEKEYADYVGVKHAVAVVNGSVTLDIAPEMVKRAISTKTKAVIAVHLAGWPCELDERRRFVMSMAFI